MNTAETDSRETPDIAAVRARLQQADAPEFWRSLDEVARTDEFLRFLDSEFPSLGELWREPMPRRSLLKMIGATLAAAGLAGCGGPPREEILPYADQPEEITLGDPLYFATAMVLDGYATGTVVQSWTGKPTKVEGNPRHPASLGATDAFSQAWVMEFWDPDRSQAVQKAGVPSDWMIFLNTLVERLATLQDRQGEGLRVLAGNLTSPTLAAQLDTFAQKYPRARVHFYHPLADDNGAKGAQLAFGEPVTIVPHFDRAYVVLSLDEDFLFFPPGRVRFAHDFAQLRRIVQPQATMNRLYVVESTTTITGAMADHRLPLPPAEIERVARAIARGLGLDVEAPAPIPAPPEWIEAVTSDLLAHKGQALVVAGPRQPPAVHLLAHAMNDRLGAPGKTLTYREPVALGPANQLESLRELALDMAEGRVDTLVMLGGNPVYDTPVDLAFGEHLKKVKLSVYHGLFYNATSAGSDWHIPATHGLETWSDARAYDGTASIVQPLIAPLYDGVSDHELVAVLNGSTGDTLQNRVREHWRRAYQGNFDAFWRQALQQGVIPNTGAPRKSVRMRPDALRALGSPPSLAADANYLSFAPDNTIWDGRFAPNAWLQELPKPISQLTWDNAALMAPAMAERLGVANEQVVELRLGGHWVHAPVWIVPGHPDRTVTATLGYGLAGAREVGVPNGFNAYMVRRSDAFWFAGGLEIRKTDQPNYPLATVQNQDTMEGRRVFHWGTLDKFRRNPRFVKDEPYQSEPPPSLYPPYEYPTYKWAMSVNLNTCIGCKACIIACQSENNIPSVGKFEVSMGRRMHWLRVDRIYHGSLDHPRIFFQPVPCMQCENAPCEYVCPVVATMHDFQGINVQVYNRCIGTRFCSNNCPYKVRRFNFLQYSKVDPPQLRGVYNPQVTVRMRGVMEKCNYCLQRIERGRIHAEVEGRKLRPGEIKTACQQVCPTNAIVFGNLNEPESPVVRAKATPLEFSLLAELNTRPRTTYTAKLINPNPKLREES